MDALDAVLAQRPREHREAAARVGAACSDAWLGVFVRAVRYDPPRPLAGGWMLVGEVRDRSWDRHALVAIHSDGRARVTWNGAALIVQERAGRRGPGPGSEAAAPAAPAR